MYFWQGAEGIDAKVLGACNDEASDVALPGNEVLERLVSFRVKFEVIVGW